MFKSSFKLTALLAVASAAVAGSALAALPQTITIQGEKVFPESMTSAADGSVFFGSIGNKMIYRAAPGSDQAVAFVQPGTDSVQSTFGLYADNKTNTLWACSNLLGPPGGPPATLYAFDLKTGAPKGHYPFVTAGGLCNDIATTADGTVFATDTQNMQVEVLKKGAKALEVWAGADGGLGPKGGAVDGISVLGKRVIVNELLANKLFSVTINKDGTAATPVEVTLDHPLTGHPDGMRSFGKSAVLIVEGGDGGKLEKITLDGNTGKIEVIKQGYPDGPVAVTVVGTTAYVCEGQLSVMMRRPGSSAPVAPLNPFKATAVEVGKP
jgi:hypothetical protein